MARLREGACTLVCFALLLLLPACPDRDETPSTPADAPTFGTTKAVVRWKVGEFSGHDDCGRPIDNAKLSGKTWVATFFFINCTGPCPDMIRALKKVHDQTEDIADLRLVAFTFDPESDTVKALADYARAWKVDPHRFHFVRLGSLDEVQKLQESFNAASAEDFHHTPLFFLVDSTGHTRRFWDARADDERGHLVHDIRVLTSGKELGQ